MKPKMVGIDEETHAALKQLAVDNCRSLSGQIKWMVESLAGTVRVPAATELGRHIVVVQHVDGSREVDPIIR